MVEKTVRIRFLTNLSELNRTMTMTTKEFGRFDVGVGRVNTALTSQMSVMGRLGVRLRSMTSGFRGFKMEMLSVMFFGMMIQKTFKGLLQPALNLSGAMSLLSTVIGLMFLPVGLDMIKLIMRLWNWWESLTESTRDFYRNLVVAGVIFGTVLMIIGQFALGIGGLIMVFGGLIVPLGIAAGILFVLSKIFGFTWKDVGKLVDNLKGFWHIIQDVGPVEAFGMLIDSINPRLIAAFKDPLPHILTILNFIVGKIESKFTTLFETVVPKSIGITLGAFSKLHEKLQENEIFATYEGLWSSLIGFWKGTVVFFIRTVFIKALEELKAAFDFLPDWMKDILALVTGGAITGAGVGSIIPGVGTGIGAGVGAGMGLLASLGPPMERLADSIQDWILTLNTPPQFTEPSTPGGEIQPGRGAINIFLRMSDGTTQPADIIDEVTYGTGVR